MNPDILEAQHKAEEMKGYADKPMRRESDYDEWIDELQPSVDELIEKGARYEQ
jgi:hypothetical protein